MKDKTPFALLQEWIEEEKQLGAPNPQQAVLSTSTKEGAPHGRVVAIREITDKGLLFFTQKGTRKVAELTDNPKASLTFWFELKQREVMIDALVQVLEKHENKEYWASYPRTAQTRFLAYAPTSGQPIESKQLLEDKKTALEQTHEGQNIPFSSIYCGYRLEPNSFTFYSYRTDELSDVCRFTKHEDNWKQECMSP